MKDSLGKTGFDSSNVTKNRLCLLSFVFDGFETRRHTAVGRSVRSVVFVAITAEYAII
jgi:hypothetical protein